MFEQLNLNSNPTFVFIDGSYYSFHRYFAIEKWWNSAFPTEPLKDPINNSKFVEKFRNTFVNNLKEMPKKLKMNKNENPIMILGKDCKRKDIWRNELCCSNKIFDGEYKGNRKNDGFMGLPLFKLVQDEDLFTKGGIMHTLKHPKLEADDCIAITVKYVLEKYPECKVYIITSDKDYLQLVEERVEIYNSNYKKLTDLKSCLGDAKLDLFCKIILGDPSDNIKPVFKNCGLTTVLKYYKNPEYFEECLKKENSYAYDSYLLNKKLIDFNEIPISLINEFTQMNLFK